MQTSGRGGFALSARTSSLALECQTIGCAALFAIGCGSGVGGASATSSGTGGAGAASSTGVGGTGGGVVAGIAPPAPEPGAPSGDGAGKVYVINSLLLGDTDRSGSPSPSAWKQFGYDIDGRISTKSSTDLCQPASGGAPSAVYPDGDSGIDNMFGKIILPILTGLASDASAQVNAQISSGDGSWLIAIDGLGAEPSYLGLTARYYEAAPLGSTPSFNGSDIWPVSAESLATATDVTSSRWPFADSYVTQDTWVSRRGTVELKLALAGIAWVLPIQQAMITMDLSLDRGAASRGVISGVMDTEDVVETLRQMAGSFDAALCTGTTFDSLADQIRQASDILIDGSQNPAQTCDAISIGVGFDAVAAALGSIAAPVTPPVDPCL